MKKIFWWILAGIVLVCAAFFIPERAEGVWSSIIASSAVAFLYLLVFVVAWLNEINSSAKRKGIAVTFAVLFVFSLAWAVINYQASQRQQETFTKVRNQAEPEMMYSHIHEPLINTLGSFYASEENNKSLGELFVLKYDSLITKDSVFTVDSFLDEESVHLYLAATDADSVVIVGESEYLDGRRADFNNYSGATGRYQVKGILTSKGVDYERQN